MGEWLRRLSGTIGELVERRAVTGCETEPLLGLVARMREAGTSVALFTDAEGRVTGLLTADDLLQRVLFLLEPDQPVAALRRRVPALSEQDRIYQAIAEMRRQRRSCLPVADAAGRPASPRSPRQGFRLPAPDSQRASFRLSACREASGRALPRRPREIARAGEGHMTPHQAIQIACSFFFTVSLARLSVAARRDLSSAKRPSSS